MAAREPLRLAGIGGAVLLGSLVLMGGNNRTYAQENLIDALTTGSVALPDSRALAEQFLQGQMQGVVVPTRSAKLAARQPGTILSIGPDNGEQFARGDVLVSFDCRRATAKLAQAQAKFDGAAARHAVQAKRVENGSAGSLKLVEAEVLLRDAEAGMALDRQAVEECTITAPFDGVVEARVANPHETVNVRDPLLSIVATADHEVRAYVPSQLLQTLTPGDRFEFLPDGAAANLVGKIVAFGARVDNVSRLVEMRGRLDAMPAHVRPGVSGQLSFDAPQTAAVAQ